MLKVEFEITCRMQVNSATAEGDIALAKSQLEDTLRTLGYEPTVTPFWVMGPGRKEAVPRRRK